VLERSKLLAAQTKPSLIRGDHKHEKESIKFSTEKLAFQSTISLAYTTSEGAQVLDQNH
jgi:hypothetical protein